MKVTMLLADFAQVADGKLNVIGAGWSITGPQPSPFAVALLFYVPWDQANENHEFRLDLLDADGQPVYIDAEEGEQPLFVEGGFEVGRPPGVRRGTHLTVPVALNLGPQPLPPGGLFVWRLTVNGNLDENWRLPFSTRPADQSANPR